ncbi:MAG: hypothetical protein QOH31_1843 [Verrucomicrobiota bacterium]
MGIDERLVSRPHLLPSRFTRTGSDGYRLTSRNGKNRTLRPSKNHSAKRKRSRMRLQLVLCDDWQWNTGCLVAQDLALLTKVRTLIHEEISLLTVLYFSVSCAHPFSGLARACALGVKSVKQRKQSKRGSAATPESVCRASWSIPRKAGMRQSRQIRFPLFAEAETAYSQLP